MSKTKTIEKVKRAEICKPKKEGGLNMIDLDTFQSGFYLKWAEQLLNKHKCEWKLNATSFFDPVGGLGVFKSNLGPKNIKGLDLVKSHFWKRVLETWLTLNKEETNNDSQINLNSPIFNNYEIRYKGQVLFLPQMIKRKIWRVKDVTKNGNLFTIEEVKQKFGSYPGLILDYNVILNAFCHIKLNSNTEQNEEDSFFFHNHKVDKIGRRKLMSLMKANQQTTNEQYWCKNKDFKITKEIWLLPFDSTKEVKTQMLQWKILHNIYPTAIILKKMGIKNSESCPSCDEKETLIHFFFRM